MPGQRKVGRSTWVFQQEVRIISSAAVAGPMEGEGKLGEYYDLIYNDLYAGQDTWEKAERKMLEDAVSIAPKKVGLTNWEIESIWQVTC